MPFNGRPQAGAAEGNVKVVELRGRIKSQNSKTAVAAKGKVLFTGQL